MSGQKRLPFVWHLYSNFNGNYDFNLRGGEGWLYSGKISLEAHFKGDNVFTKVDQNVVVVVADKCHKIITVQ